MNKFNLALKNKKTKAERDAASKAKCVKILMENANLRKQLNYKAGSTVAPSKKEEDYRKQAYNDMIDTFNEMLPHLKDKLRWSTISLPGDDYWDRTLPKWLQPYARFARKYMARSDKLKNSKYEM